MESQGIDEELYRRIGDGLLGSWHELDDNPFNVGRMGRPWTQAQFCAVHGLTAHVHRLYVAAGRLLDEGWVIEALPMIRTAYECALTAQWLAQADDASTPLNEGVAPRRRTEQAAQRTVLDSVRGHGFTGVDVHDVERSPADPDRDFAQLCRDLIPGGSSAYVGHQIMSMYAEPSVALVDEYLATDESGELTGLMLAPGERSSGAWRGVLVATLVWAGRALDYFDLSHRRRSQLRAAARDLGIESALQLTPDALRRLDQRRRAPLAQE